MSNSLVMMAVSHFAFLSSRTSSGHFFLTVFYCVTHDEVSKRGLLLVYISRVQSYQSIDQSINQSTTLMKRASVLPFAELLIYVIPGSIVSVC